MQTRPTTLAVLLVLVLAGFALRLHNLAFVPLRGDEAFSVQYWARYDLSRSLTEIATIEPHPLLTYITFRGWGLLAGTGEFAMRLLPALMNLLGIPALYALGRRLGGTRLGFIAALLWTIHPYEIWYAQDARNYGIWAGLSAVGLWLGYRAAEHNRRMDWFLYALAATFASNIYYDELFTITAFALYILIVQWGEWRRIRRAALAMSIPVLTPLLSFLVLQGTLLGGGGYGGTASRFDLARLPQFLVTLNFGSTLPADWVNFLGPIIAITTLASLFLLWRHHRNQALFLGLLIGVPFVLISLASSRFRIFAPHYIISTVPAFILLLPVLVGMLSLAARTTIKRSQRRSAASTPGNVSRLVLLSRSMLPLSVLAFWFALDAYSLHNYYYDPAYRKSANWPAATNYLGQYASPDDLVIQLSIDPAFGYYYDASAQDIALPSKPTQPDTEIITLLEAFTANKHTAWLVGQPYPDWPNRDIVEEWMRENWQPLLDTSVAGLRIQGFRSWSVNPTEIESSPLATFGDISALVGTRLFLPPETGGNLTLWLYWRALDKSTSPLKIFVHLVGTPNPSTGSPLWAQDDQYPQEGRISTNSWEIGTVYRDIYTLSLASLPPGTYDLRVGLYDPVTDERLTVEDGDSYLAQTIVIP